MEGFTPTTEQEAIINHAGSAFIVACPGAGKTRCIVERARSVLRNSSNARTLAFLSFTNAAVSELQERLVAENLLPQPVFPHYIGTFDSFIWHYLVQPYGIDGCDRPLSIIPDSGGLLIKPFDSAQPLRLDCFHRTTGEIIADEAARVGFNRNPTSYETAAKRLRARLLEQGQLDFDDVRRLAKELINDGSASAVFTQILSSRFHEIIVDEAQDCNPDDLLIIDWLRVQAGIPTKVVCDPHQSIYGFRGGVSDELVTYGDTFNENNRLILTGNFRSSSRICQVIHRLRMPSQRGLADVASGDFKTCPINVHVISYSGQSVTSKIGNVFLSIVSLAQLDPNDCRVAAKTRDSGLKAIGAYTGRIGQSLSLRLASAVIRFHHAESNKEMFSAIKDTHSIVLELKGTMNGRSYHQVIHEDEIDAVSWRGQIVEILNILRFDNTAGHNREEWIIRARSALIKYLPTGSGSIAQKLQNIQRLDEILGCQPTPGLVARTIHEVKGKQFPGMCVVLTTASAAGILTHLESEPDTTNAESVRELYVATSRAQKLLVIACPRNQSARLINHLSADGSVIEVTEI